MCGSGGGFEGDCRKGHRGAQGRGQPGAKKGEGEGYNGEGCQIMDLGERYVAGSMCLWGAMSVLNEWGGGQSK